MDNAPTMNQAFDSARNQAAHDKSRQQAINVTADTVRLNSGQLEEDQLLRPVKAALVDKEGSGNPNSKRKKAKDAVTSAILREINRQLAETQQRMADLHEILQAKYGDDVVGGLAATHLPPDVLAKLKTEGQKMQALADLMLNPDGTIKDKYKDSPDAQYVQAWDQAQKLLDKRAEIKNTSDSKQKSEINLEAENIRDSSLSEKQTHGFNFN